jgi:hypothetical protein
MSSAAVAATSAAVSIPAYALPVTLEGKFELSVETGDVSAAGVSEFNFGTLDVKGAMHLVQISGAVLGASGVSRDSNIVRATLGSRTDAYGAPTYIVTAMTKVVPSATLLKP